MNYQPKAIRPFVGAKNFQESRAFYQALDFEEVILSGKMSLFKVNDQVGFYLQDYYVEDWVSNSVLFLQVDDLEKCAKDLVSKDLPGKYKQVKLSPVKQQEWGKELYLHDPSGILWHFGEFNKQ